MPYKPAMTIRLDEDTYSKINDIAIINDRSLNNQVEYILKLYLEYYEEAKNPFFKQP